MCRRMPQRPDHESLAELELSKRNTRRQESSWDTWTESFATSPDADVAHCQAAFRRGSRSVSLLTTRSAGNPSSSGGWLPRLIQKVVRPKEAAPAMSHELDETKPVAFGAVPSLFEAIWYTRGLGL